MSKNKVTPELIEQALVALKPQHEKLLEEAPANVGELPRERQVEFYAAENKRMREELKRLNEFITLFVGYRRLGITIHDV
jgi:hypothetical protein